LIKVSEIWRYPVKSMGGERIDAAALGERGLHADRMWAVRDPALGAISTARRLPPLLRCQARYAGDPVCAEPGDAPEVVISLPGGLEISSADPDVHARLSELLETEVRLESIPPTTDKDAYRAPRETKAELRAAFGLAEDEPLPDLSVFPLRKLAELSRYVTPIGSLFDAYPVHVITRASLDTMAALAPGSDFDVRRFRPNIVVETEPGDGLPENAWCNADLDLPGADLHGEIPTLRCVMPIHAQRDLATDPQVLRTVAKHANRCLGIYATVSRPGVVTVGDEIVIRAPAALPQPVAMARAGAHNVKRGILRAANAMMPKE
jgi:uncharacterized protein YcbX